MWAVLLVALLLALPARVEAAITASFLTHGNGTLGVEFQASADTAPTGTFGAAGPIVVNCAELAETVAIRRHRVYQQ